MHVVKFFLVCFVVVARMNAAGDKLVVPGDYASIQAAIEAVGPGGIIEVGPGIYEENLVIRRGIELRGAGSDSTIVRNVSNRGKLLRVIDTVGVHVSGFTFQHSDTASLPPNRTLFPDAIEIINSGVEIHSCGVGPSAGCGITIDQKSQCSVVECLFEGNSQSGIFVRGEGTKATLQRNRCINNQYGGISITKGAQAVAEENICLNNGEWGARILDKGASIILKNNTFSLNRGPGVTVEKWAHGIVEGNVSNENDANGIIFKLGANGSVLGNTVEKNARHGIAVQSLAAAVEVSNNTCNENRRNGIGVFLGAGGDVTGNTCRGNGWNGIAVGGWFTNPVVRDNECSENARHGVLFERSATGKAEGNVCRGNKLHGILVVDEDTQPDIGHNVCEDNGGEGIAREDGVPVSRQNQIDDEEIGYALAAEYFDKLEKMARLLRQHKCRYSAGAWQLGHFYRGLKTGYGDITPDNREAFASLIERWKKAHPESVTPLITQAEVHVAYGWDARGGDSAHTVTDEGWATFYKELGIARDYLLEAEALNGNDPNLYNLLLNVCNCLDCSASELQAIFDKGIAIDLGYFPLYYTKAWYLTRRWGGRRGELERFAEKAFALTQEMYGYTMYALIASSIAIRMGAEDFMRKYSFDWEKIDKGCMALIEAFPDFNYYLNQHCLMACVNGDQQKAQKLFDKIGGNMDDDVWRNRSEFRKWRQWASGNTLAARQELADKAPHSSLESSTIAALREKLALLFENISWAERAMICALLFFVIAFFLFAVSKKRQSQALLKSRSTDDNKEDDKTTI